MSLCLSPFPSSLVVVALGSHRLYNGSVEKIFSFMSCQHEISPSSDDGRTHAQHAAHKRCNTYPQTQKQTQNTPLLVLSMSHEFARYLISLLVSSLALHPERVCCMFQPVACFHASMFTVTSLLSGFIHSCKKRDLNNTATIDSIISRLRTPRAKRKHQTTGSPLTVWPRKRVYV